MNTHPLLLLLSAALASCSLLKPKPKDVAFDENAQGTLPIPSYTRNALDGWPEGRKLDPTDSSRVRFADGIHAYHIGRLPSADRREMHEAHTVYRVEQSARWDQRLPATPMSSRGVVLGIREPSSSPIPPDQVVSNERARQLDMSAKLEKQIADLNEKSQKVSAFLASAPDKTKAVEELTATKAKLEKELAETQAAKTELERKVKDLEDQQEIQNAMTRKRDGATRK